VRVREALVLVTVRVWLPDVGGVCVLVVFVVHVLVLMRERLVRVRSASARSAASFATKFNLQRLSEHERMHLPVICQ
jgi:hypothetical protein